MPRYLSPPTTPATARVGVLLVNLGSPSAPTPSALRRFLAQMLSDPRLIETPRALWLPILHGVILRIRPRRSAKLYRKIWMPEGSPLIVYAHRLAHGLQNALADIDGGAAVAVGMSYGEPSIAAGLQSLRERGVERLIVVPLYPQYAGVTTASVFDSVAVELGRWRVVPEVRFIHDYHDAPDYIEALKASVLEHWEKHGRSQQLLMSFHSMPKKLFEKGDPYYTRCQETARLLAQALGLGEKEWGFSFQSRFGYEEWLQPYTAEVVRERAQNGVLKLTVICPGFSLDCLESLEEIAITARESFLEHGGESFDYIPALNDRADHVAVLSRIVRHS
ncbi:MAG TPA: ferrochelatase [Steroidobacteraceae bacterium]|nr:ferrochelatase [Steroidobacteraceae bacterium]